MSFDKDEKKREKCRSTVVDLISNGNKNSKAFPYSNVFSLYPFVKRESIYYILSTIVNIFIFFLHITYIQTEKFMIWKIN